MQPERMTLMPKLTELTILLREGVDLPAGLKLVTEEFREGWNIVKARDANWLDKSIRRRKWHFLSMNEGTLRSGVGETSQEAIAGGLRLALRQISARFNAARVERIEIKQYPWFFLARVRVYPYQIQQSAVLSVAEEAISLAMPFPAESIAGKVNHTVSAAS